MNGLTDLGKTIRCDSVEPLGIFQWVSWSSHNTGFSEKGRFCPGDNCIDCECGRNWLQKSLSQDVQARTAAVLCLFSLIWGTFNWIKPKHLAVDSSLWGTSSSPPQLPNPWCCYPILSASIPTILLGLLEPVSPTRCWSVQASATQIWRKGGQTHESKYLALISEIARYLSRRGMNWELGELDLNLALQRWAAEPSTAHFSFNVRGFYQELWDLFQLLKCTVFSTLTKH